MGVEYLVVRCCKESCMVFQCIQKTKSKGFKCKVCQTRQSLQKIYAQSYKAKDLRPIVQEYNLVEGKKRAKEQKRRDRMAAAMPDFGVSLEASSDADLRIRMDEAAEQNIWKQYEIELDYPEEEPGSASTDVQVTLRDSSALLLRRRRKRGREDENDAQLRSSTRPAAVQRPHKRRATTQAPVEAPLLHYTTTGTAAGTVGRMKDGGRARGSHWNRPASKPSEAPSASAAVSDTYRRMEEASKDNIWATFTIPDEGEAAPELAAPFPVQARASACRLPPSATLLDGADEY